MKPFHNVEVRTAHDVRRIEPCTYCRGMGDKRRMIPPICTNVEKGYAHGRCYAKKHGRKAFLDLPRDITDRLTWGDIGTLLMKALLEKPRNT